MAGSATALASERQGLIYAVAAYGFWGLAPMYFVWINYVPPLEVLMHRVLWSVPLLTLLITITKQWAGVWGLGRHEVAFLLVTALCLSINWGTFIWAIQAQRIADASLGYFINPLINVMLGRLFLGERMRPLQWLAIGVAFLGVNIELWTLGSVPWLGLTLAFSFGFYGLLRKQVSVPAAIGLWVETMLMLPIAGLFFVWLVNSDGLRPSVEIAQLALGGVISVVPLVLFAAAALRLSLTALGFVQYLAPSCALMLAVFLYHEPVADIRWLTFSFIWLALIIFSLENLFNMRQRRQALEER